MNSTTVIPTDLVTPLGAYLRLREAGPAAFLLESVEHGRLGRHSFVGCGTGARLVRRGGGATRAGRRLPRATTTRRRSSRPCRCRQPARAAPESRFVVAEHARPLRPRARPRRGALGRSGSRPPHCSRGRGQTLPPRRRPKGHTRRFPSRLDYERGVRSGDRAHPRRRRVPDRALAARGAADRGRRDRRLPDAASDQPVAVQLPARARRPLARRLVARDARRSSTAGARASTRSRAPCRRGPGDVEKLLASEKDRAEHVMLVDLGRNDLSRVCEAGSVKVERFLEAERFSHVTHLVSEVAGDAPRRRERRSTCSAPASRRERSPALPRCARCRSSPSSRAYRRGRTPARSAIACPDGSLDTCIAIRTIVLRDGVAYLQAGAGIVADSSHQAEHEECLRKLAALETALNLAEADAMKILLVDNYDSFTYNLAHLLEELGGEVVVQAQRRDRRRRGGGTRADPPRRLTGAGATRGIGRHARHRPAPRADDADARRLPRPPGDRRGVRRRDRPGQAAPAREGERDPARRPRHLRRPAAGLQRRPLPLAGGSARSRRARGVGASG